MKLLLSVAVAVLISCLVEAVPLRLYDNGVLIRTRRSPHRAMMFGGYYSNPGGDQRGFAPEGGMSAFAAGDALYGGSYLGQRPNECANCGGEYAVQATEAAPVEPVTEAHNEEEIVPQPEPVPVEETDVTVPEEEVTQKPAKAKPPKRKQRPQEESDEEEDDGADFPVFPKGGRRKNPVYTSFFPVMFGYSGVGRSGTEGAFPGGATAIANSFSTGKGGVATSHATAFGDPASYRNANWKRRAAQQD